MPVDKDGNTVINVPTAELKITTYAPKVVISPYSLAASSTDSQVLKDAIMALEPVFTELPDAVLHVAAHDESQPVGPLVGNPDVPEETLRHLAKFELKDRQNQRDAAASERRWRLERVVLPTVGLVGGYILKSLLG